jgi:Reverse transcriptase (RNA-dependent DNA polymerase)
LIDRVAGCTTFTVIDLKNAFNLVRVKEGDEWKTAFRTRLGLFKYTVMPFGLTNAPATFQAFIQDTLHDILDISCVAYIDDILIFSKPDQDHTQLVIQVLERLRKAKLFANAPKCEFDQSFVDYLGYLISAQGVQMNPKNSLPSQIGLFQKPLNKFSLSLASPILSSIYSSLFRNRFASPCINN